MSNDIDQQFVVYIVKSLVGHPDEVSVERTIDEKGVLLTLSVHPEDLGRVIGRRGTTAQSLRTLLRALGTKNDARYNLKIVDTDNPEQASETNSDDTEEPTTQDTEESTGDQYSSQENNDDLVQKTRKDLADMDDLDI